MLPRPGHSKAALGQEEASTWELFRVHEAALVQPTACLLGTTWTAADTTAIPVLLYLYRPQAAYERARKVLVVHLHELHALAGALLEKETLSGDQIKSLLTEVEAKGGKQAPEVQAAMAATAASLASKAAASVANAAAAAGGAAAAS